MLKIYNTLTKTKESFTPAEKGTVSMYNCGPTVYSRLTIGNLRSFLFADILRRTLEYLDYDVTQVMNITDVGHLTMTDEQKEKNKDAEITDTDDGVDRMEKAAKKEGKTVWEVAEYYTDLFLEDIKELNIKIPHHLPKATDHIEQQIEMIKKLQTNGYAYVTENAVYFDTGKFDGYGELSGQAREDKQVAVRNEVEEDKEKKHPADFRLWQLNQPDHAMQWESPWGRGYPGWHIECSAMSLDYLPQPIDIHTGGTDHIPVHHTNEIAQAEGATGKTFVNYWMHGAFLTVDNKRMGKSLGNAYTLQDLNNKGFGAMDLRYFLLTANYRQIQNFTWEGLEAAKTRLNKIREIVSEWQSEASGKQGLIIEELRNEFIEAISDDLNMPAGLAVVSKLLDYDASVADRLATLMDFNRVLGLELESEEIFTSNELDEIARLVKERAEYRKNKQWDDADAIRKELEDRFSVEVEDTSTGPKWRRTV